MNHAGEGAEANSKAPEADWYQRIIGQPERLTLRHPFLFVPRDRDVLKSWPILTGPSLMYMMIIYDV